MFVSQQKGIGVIDAVISLALLSITAAYFCRELLPLTAGIRQAQLISEQKSKQSSAYAIINTDFARGIGTNSAELIFPNTKARLLPLRLSCLPLGGTKNTAYYYLRCSMFEEHTAASESHIFLAWKRR